MQMDQVGAIVSRFMLTVRDDVDLAAVQERLRADPRFAVGEPRGRRLPLISRDADLDEAEASFRELSDCPHYEYVDLLASFLDAHQG